MVEFSKFMGDYALLVGEEAKSKTYRNKAEEIKEQLLDKLYNKNVNLFCDYVGLQFTPKVHKNGHLAEPIEWR